MPRSGSPVQDFAHDNGVHHVVPGERQGERSGGGVCTGALIRVFTDRENGVVQHVVVAGIEAFDALSFHRQQGRGGGGVLVPLGGVKGAVRSAVRDVAEFLCRFGSCRSRRFLWLFSRRLAARGWPGARPAPRPSQSAAGSLGQGEPAEAR